jgi:predicted ATP-dependent serine protease
MWSETIDMTTITSDSSPRVRGKVKPSVLSVGNEVVRGRDGEQKTVRDLLRRAQRGVGGVVLVKGEPGIGKSLLLRAFTDEAARQGFWLATGAAGPTGGVLPGTC